MGATHGFISIHDLSLNSPLDHDLHTKVECQEEPKEEEVIYFPRPPAYDPNRELTPAQKERMREAFRKVLGDMIMLPPEVVEQELKDKESEPPGPEASLRRPEP